MIDQILLVIALIAVFVIVFFSFNLLKGAAKFTAKRLKKTPNDEEAFSAKTKEYFEKYDEILENEEEAHARKDIRPQGNQYRDLDRETGGLEAAKAKESDGKNPWNDRSDEIDRVGSIFQLGGSGKESMLWRKKKEKIDDKSDDKKEKKKRKKKGNDDHDDDKPHGRGSFFDSRKHDRGGSFVDMVKDHGGGHGLGGGGHDGGLGGGLGL